MDASQDSKKKLARVVAKAFHSAEEYVIVDALVRNSSMTKKELMTLLQLDKRSMNARISTLMRAKFLDERTLKTILDGKRQSTKSFAVNYENVVNVTKYRIDHIRLKLDKEANPKTVSYFKCTGCDKSYAEVYAGELFDPETQSYYCTVCKAPVQEMESLTPAVTSTVSFASIKEEMKLLFDIMQDIDDSEQKLQKLDTPKNRDMISLTKAEEGDDDYEPDRIQEKKSMSTSEAREYNRRAATSVAAINTKKNTPKPYQNGSNNIKNYVQPPPPPMYDIDSEEDKHNINDSDSDDSGDDGKLTPGR